MGKFNSLMVLICEYYRNRHAVFDMFHHVSYSLHNYNSFIVFLHFEVRC